MNRREALAGLLALAAPTLCRAQEGGPAAFVVRDRDGRALGSAGLLGRITLVHFWASWCASCRTEFPALAALHRDFAPQGLRLLAVSIDRLGWPVIDATLRTVGTPELPAYHDLNREAAASMRVEALPTTVILDAQGREIERHKGAVDWADAEVRGRLGLLLQGTSIVRAD